MTVDLFVGNHTVTEKLQNRFFRSGFQFSSHKNIKDVADRINTGAEALVLEVGILDPDDIRQLQDLLAGLPKAERPSLGLIVEGGLPEAIAPTLELCDLTLLPEKFLENTLPAFIAELEARKNRCHEADSSQQVANSVSLKCMAQMCHDLRTPLTAIQGYVELIEESAHGSMHEVKQPLLQNCKAIETIITSAIEMSHISLSGQVMELEPVNLQDLFSALMNQFSLEAQRKGLKLVLTAGTDAIVQGERKALHRILSNLLCNAIKFTHSGTVSMSVAAGEQKVSIFIEDSGPGVPEAFLDRMFQPFERADASSSTIGTGLGLSIARQLAGLMGGHIRGENKKEGGMRFTVILLRATGDVTATAERPSSHQLQQSGISQSARSSYGAVAELPSAAENPE